MGAGRAYLEEKAAQGNLAAQPDLTKIGRPKSGFLWGVFLELSRSRESGINGPSPIKTAEIQAFCEFNEITKPATKRRIYAAVRAMDSVFLKWADSQGQKPNGDITAKR